MNHVSCVVSNQPHALGGCFTKGGRWLGGHWRPGSASVSFPDCK